MTDSSRRPGRRVASLAGGVAFGAVFAWLAIRGADLQDVHGILAAGLRPAPVLAAVLLYLLYFVLKSLRWRLILRPVTAVPTLTLFPYVMVGYLGNLALPFQLGEAYRGYLLSRDQPIDAVTAVSSIVLEKVFDVFVVVALALAALQFVPIDDGFLTPLQVGISCLSVVGLLGLVLVLLRPAWAVTLALRLQRGLPSGRFFTAARVVLKRAAQGLAVLTDFRQSLQVLVLSLLSWLCMLTALHGCMLALGLSVSPATSAIILLFSVLGLSLPTSPGFVGTIQIAFVSGAQLFAVDREQALAASILYNLLITLPPVLPGVLCLMVLYRRRAVLSP